ncbi:potassium/proton antiporter [Anaerohalosphaera lusitana]|uniref:Potassium/proton antiporter n=1 Tax=Anaerohalosphaera lusitana TaxID=1936003 RepID=A0A1U9NM81_9BACT|nr:cation:proton antiporter [Anaerohalosphaera lusitana]AQT68616.1 potassium/proton antiporter [Anaerohalosphaera lusitana]
MEDIGVLLVFGISIFGGLLGASFFQKIRVPQVVGYIAIGLIIGQSGFKLVGTEDIQRLQPFNLFALGVIGFLVGGELKLESFKKYAKQFSAILLGEGLGAFFLVGLASGTALYFVFDSAVLAMAAGIVFGAIASATDPASTMDVLWEYRGRGVLTTSLIAIVALDDALAMTLYGIGTGVAELMTSSDGSILEQLKVVGIELFGAVAVGFVFALALRFILMRVHQKERSLAFALGLILLLIGIASKSNMDVILAAMTLGFVLTNIVPRQSEELFGLLRGVSVPIYVLFFVLVGARIGLANMPAWLWGIVAIYVLGRSIGKMGGAYLGAKLTNSPVVVQRYLGMGLFAQGGVAIGLSIMASHHLGEIEVQPGLMLGDVIVFGVTATTLIVQLIGPAMAKLAIKFADEIGRNITREDVIESLKVEDVMDKDVLAIRDSEPLINAVDTFVENDFFVYPVVDRSNQIVGIISIEGLKNILADQEAWHWLVASDVMQPADDKAVRSAPLKNTLETMVELRIDQMPVVQTEGAGEPIGMLDLAHVRERVSIELLKRQQPAIA